MIKQNQAIIKGDFMEIEQNCYNCINRNGKFCKAKNKHLTLIKVEKNILKFKDQENCNMYEGRETL